MIMRLWIINKQIMVKKAKIQTILFTINSSEESQNSIIEVII